MQGVVTDYTLHGKNIVHMTQGSNELHFFYDAQNKPAVVVFNGIPYSYVKNLQGDIIAILDNAGTAVVRYTYDAWGAPTSTTGTMAATLGMLNPFRYRGYVYDEETQMYYLRSRYYYANLCRFINADVPQVAELKCYHHNQYNLYLYCNNRPVIDRDDEGALSLFGKIALGIGLVVCAAAVTVLTCGVGTATIAGAVAVGAAKGALVGAAIGTAAGAAIGYAATGTLEGTLEGAACGFGVCAVTGAVIGGVCGAGQVSPGKPLLKRYTIDPNNPQINVDPHSLTVQHRSNDQLLPSKLLKNLWETVKNRGEFRVPVEVNIEGVIQQGHHRTALAKLLQTTVKVIVK